MYMASNSHLILDTHTHTHTHTHTLSRSSTGVGEYYFRSSQSVQITHAIETVVKRLKYEALGMHQEVCTAARHAGQPVQAYITTHPTRHVIRETEDTLCDLECVPNGVCTWHTTALAEGQTRVLGGGQTRVLCLYIYVRLPLSPADADPSTHCVSFHLCPCAGLVQTVWF